MSSYVNYLLEANLLLCAFAFLFLLLFRKETNFAGARIILLIFLLSSLLFPVFHLKATGISIPQVGDLMPSILLPEFVVAGHPVEKESQTFVPSTILPLVYLLGLVIALFIFLLRLSTVIRLIAKSTCIRKGNLLVAESDEPIASFSFFNFVMIGSRNDLTLQEKEKILAHESIHVRQFHSFDILILNIIGVFFWFNPVLRIYKNLFTQLHEFEADARSVEDNEVSEYCNLLARVALLSADIRIANHFSNSLTLKRIQMMRTIKSKIGRWKIVSLAIIVPAVFFFVACQDQMVNEVAKSSTIAIDIPETVQSQLDQMKAANPDKQILVVEVDAAGQAKAKDLKEKMDNLPQELISSVNVIKVPAKDDTPQRNFIIVVHDDNLKSVQQASKSDGDVYNIVDETALPSNGIDGFYRMIGENIRYDKEAREKNVEGKVFVSFVVEPDGTLTDVSVLKGVHPALDAEALRVVKLSPKWIPGKNNGVAVRQRQVLPISFHISG
jgi:TonB family protein